MDRSQLRGFERIAVPLMEIINASRWLKRCLHAVIGGFNALWIEWSTGVDWKIDGLQQVLSLQAPKGMILVSNHRSFFDMYIGSTIINRRTRLMRRVCYPIRSNFFYTNPAGFFVNLLMSGASMWPPVFRDQRKRALNPTGMALMGRFLSQEGGVLGIHPEGQRSTGEDPYQLLPARPGLGRLVEVCDPEVVVLPFFIVGMSNDFVAEVSRRFRRPDERRPPIRVRFGEPIQCGALHDDRDAMGISAAVMEVIAELGAEDRAEHGEHGTMERG